MKLSRRKKNSFVEIQRGLNVGYFVKDWWNRWPKQTMKYMLYKPKPHIKIQLNDYPIEGHWCSKSFLLPFMYIVVLVDCSSNLGKLTSFVLSFYQNINRKSCMRATVLLTWGNTAINKPPAQVDLLFLFFFCFFAVNQCIRMLPLCKN